MNSRRDWTENMTHLPNLTARTFPCFSNVHIVRTLTPSISAAILTETPMRSMDSVGCSGFGGIRMTEFVPVGMRIFVMGGILPEEKIFQRRIMYRKAQNYDSIYLFTENHNA